ncbi:hypothetical protein J8J14_21200 [Roseomonas sp. SSH11]|uniref:Uncharacterized protein n=1 Tax=Pararoseomonas baculiformis TaxID=2820812 RepID=A0ABS4ALB5_9PROT|nr:hypothetical protein [Pararoseomonas baculiformis]MBP0447293.1 hypothetical protein [Pararoseomonas baculiformis]
MSSKLWSLGILLVALGIAAHVVGWDVLLWLPMTIADSLFWVPMAIIDAVSASPATFGIVALGVVLMIVARFMGRHRG